MRAARTGPARTIEELRVELGLVTRGPRTLGSASVLERVLLLRSSVEADGGRFLHAPRHYAHAAVTDRFRKVRASPVVHVEYALGDGREYAAHLVTTGAAPLSTRPIDPASPDSGVRTETVEELYSARSRLTLAGLEVVRSVYYDHLSFLDTDNASRVARLHAALVFADAPEASYRDAVNLTTALVDGAPAEWALRRAGVAA